MGNKVAVYILAGRRGGELYTGLTDDLPGRALRYRNLLAEGLLARHARHALVYIEWYADRGEAERRLRRLRRWREGWLRRLVTTRNPRWLDLWNQLIP